jgi:hypothetical protein
VRIRGCLTWRDATDCHTPYVAFLEIALVGLSSVDSGVTGGHLLHESRLGYSWLLLWLGFVPVAAA